MKKIAIDCRTLRWKHSGIARYLRNVLIELMKSDTENQYFLLNFSDSADLGRPLPANFMKIEGPTGFFFYKFLWTPYYLRSMAIDTYWSPTHDLPLVKLSSCRFICTIHDIAFEHKNITTSLNVRILKFLGVYRLSVYIADTIFTDSYYSKDDIFRKYGVANEKIVVTYLGVDEIFHPIDKKQARDFVHSEFKVSTPYIFFINTGKPRNLLLAFSELVRSSWKDNDIQLVCLGGSADKTQDIPILIEEMGLHHRVMFIKTHVTDNELVNLYAGAMFFVSPSFFEGFGLTPLEALTCGTPVLISNVTALPEIFGGSATYLDPANIEDIQASLESMYNQKQNEISSLSNSVNIDKYKWVEVVRTMLPHII